MPEPWLLLPTGDVTPGSVVVLDGEEARHAAGALRLRRGDAVVLADGCGLVARARLSLLARSRAEVVIEAVTREPEPQGPGITLALAVLHGQAMDWAVQKAVEVGVRTFVPVLTDRSQLPARATEGRLNHWRRLGRQALKQCHRSWEMAVCGPTRLADLVAARGGEGGLVADRCGRDLRDIPPPAAPLLLVGPEGGFTSAEEQLLEAASWRRVCLGPFVLRAETAAVVGAAMLGVGNSGAHPAHAASE
jgi:16S rRNA (uracil1498-N3)-methyltransferase